MVAMEIWCHLTNYFFYQFVLDKKNIKSHQKSAFYTGWRKRYGCLNKKWQNWPPGPDGVKTVIAM